MPLRVIARHQAWLARRLLFMMLVRGQSLAAGSAGRDGVQGAGTGSGLVRRLLAVARWRPPESPLIDRWIGAKGLRPPASKLP
jgi:hypothetical protein